MGNEIYRAGEKVGWVDGNHIRSHDNKILGYFDDKHVYDMERHTLAYTDGEYLYSEGSRSGKVELDKINEDIKGGVLMEMAKCAIYVLLGG